MAYSGVYTTAYRDTYGVAPLSDAYPGNYTSGYGVPFPAAPLDARLALQLAGVWTDVSKLAYQRAANSPVTITRGRRDESSSTNPATLSVELNNRGGNLSPRNPLGTWYGQLGRNTPLRCSVPGLEPYLRLEDDATSGASCPDSGALDVTGQIDVRVDVRPSGYQPCVLVSKWLGLTSTGGAVPATVGATITAADYKTGSVAASSAAFNKILGGTRTPGTNAQRSYHAPGAFGGPSADDLALLATKCQLVVSWKPALDGSDWTALSASISAYAAAAAAAGAPPPMLLLWHEPQNSKNNLTAAQFKAMMAIYYPLVKAAYGLQLGYDAITTGAGSVTAYYPGDAFCDYVMQDLYGNQWQFGHAKLDSLQALANAGGKPMGLGEFAETTNAAKRLTTTQFNNFIAYLQSVFVTRSLAGLNNTAVMWWDGADYGDANCLATSGDPRVPALQGFYDALSSASGGGSTSAQRSWALVLNGDGTLGFWWTTDGTLATLQKATSAVPMPLGRVTARVLVTITSGVATVTFYTAGGGNAGSTGTGAPWSQLGPAVTGLTVKIFSGSAPLQAGYNAAVTADSAGYGGLTGAVYECQLRSFEGLYPATYTDTYGTGGGGQVVAHAGFTGQAEGVTSFADAQGNTWSLSGTAEISQRSYRFHGEVATLPAEWDVTGTDVYAPIQASGQLRRLSQGQQPPVQSAFKRAVLGRTGALVPVAYWPAEGASGATQIGPAIGPAPITFGVPPQMAADSTFACSAPIPVVAAAVMTGPVAPYTGGTAAIIRFLLHVAAGSTIADDSILCRANTTGSVGDFTLRYKTGGQLRLTGYGGGAYLFDTGALAQFSLIGAACLVSMELTVSGANLAYAISVLAVGSSAPTTVSGTVIGVPGNVTAARYSAPGGNLAGVGLGHMFVQSAYEPITNFASPLAAWAGEPAAARFARLCGENGIAARIYGYPATDVPMGVQAPDTLASLLQLCETTGRGLMFEPRANLGLGYRTVNSLCQQPPAVTASYAQAHLGEDSGTKLTPTADDQHTVNDVTVSNAGGSSYEAVLNDGSPMSVSPPPAGVGDYGNSYTVNVAADAQLASLAWWIVNIGTNAEDRYPLIPFNLARAAVADIYYALQDADIGAFVQIIGTPAFLAPGPVKQLLYGTAEILGGFRWSMQWNTVPEAPYEVGIYADPVFGRMDTDGAALDSAIPAGPVADGFGDTYAAAYGAAVAAMYVDTTGPSGILWTTAAADFPFDVLVGGEQMTVTAVSGTASPQLFTVVRGVNGVVKAHSAGEGIRLAHPAIIGLA